MASLHPNIFLGGRSSHQAKAQCGWHVRVNHISLQRRDEPCRHPTSSPTSLACNTTECTSFKNKSALTRPDALIFLCSPTDPAPVHTSKRHAQTSTGLLERRKSTSKQESGHLSKESVEHGHDIPDDAVERSSNLSADKMVVCKFFLQGNCRFGGMAGDG